MTSLKLPCKFYQQPDVVQLSREFVGKALCTHIDGTLTTGIITETEAYRGRNDKACHAHGRRTPRTEIMYQEGGYAYVYVCYGIHHLFNIVTNKEGQADAVLVRAVKPAEGIEQMLKRRGADKITPALTAGPGRLTQALGITKEHYGTDLEGDTIWIEERGISLSDDEIASSSRIGVDYAGEDARRPWRFYIKNSNWIS